MIIINLHAHYTDNVPEYPGRSPFASKDISPLPPVNRTSRISKANLAPVIVSLRLIIFIPPKKAATAAS